MLSKMIHKYTTAPYIRVMVDVNTEGAGKMVHIILCEHWVLNNSMLVTFQKQTRPGRPEVGDLT